MANTDANSITSHTLTNGSNSACIAPMIWHTFAHIISDVLLHTLTMQEDNEEGNEKGNYKKDTHNKNNSEQENNQPTQTNALPDTLANNLPNLIAPQPHPLAVTSSCLIVCHQTYIEEASHFLAPAINQHLHALNHLTPALTFVTNADFLNSHYHQQYDLGCHIDTSLLMALFPQVSQTPPPTSLNDDTATSTSLTHRISTRLRDLFAQHSLILTDEYTNLLAFGFVKMALPSLPTADVITKEAKDITSKDTSAKKISIKDTLKIWQFNLYDYKPQPDWLNARYWANPENFDKYRW